MNEALQNLEIKVENGGTTPQGRLTSSEWNILVAAVKALDADPVDPSQLEAYLKPYAKTADVASTYATIASLSAVTSRLNDFLSGSDTDAIINKWSELETFLAGLTETDNLATILSGKANKATTLAGYGITDAYTKSHIDSNFVTIGTKQEITGEKDFVGGFKVNGGLVEYNATLKTWVFNGDLLVTGGMAAFSNISGFKPSTITEAVLIDNKTIKLNADGLLYAVPQGAGGINEDQLKEYLTTKGYITSSGSITGNAATATKLKNYYSSRPTSADVAISGDGSLLHFKATSLMTTSKPTGDGHILHFNWDNNQGYDAQLFLPTGGNAVESTQYRTQKAKTWGSWKTLLDSSNYSSYALPITGGTVNGAVTINHSGNTPLVINQNYGTASNPRGVVVMNSTLSNSNLYISHLFGKEGSMRNSAWVGFYLDSAGSNNNRLSMGLYGVDNVLNILGSGNVAIGGTTASEKLEVHGKVKATSFIGNASSASKLQNAVSLWGRTFDGSADLTGSVAVTTGEGYRINYNGYDLRFIISGSSSNRGIWDNTNNNWLMYRSGSNDIYFTSGNIGFGTTSPTEKVTVGGNINLSGDYNYKIRGKDVVSIYSTNYYLADSAIELGYNTFVVGRKINFQTSTSTAKTTTATLDGSGNFSITGVLNLPAVDSGFTNPRITFGDSVIRIGATTAGLLGVYASGDIRLNPNSASSANSTMGLWLKASGFNGVNISNPTQALHVNGKGIFADATNPWVALQRNGENWYLQVVSTGLKLGKASASSILVDASGNMVAPGGVTATNSSDERLKRNIRKFNAREVLMSLGGVWEYEYIDSEVQKNHIYEGTHYGLIYQHVKGTTLDVMCHEREDGFGTLNYIHQKFISLIAGAIIENISEVEKLKRDIRHLKAKVKQLEQRS